MVDLLRAWDRAWAWLAGARSEPAPAFVASYDEVYASLDPAQLRGDDTTSIDDLLFRVDGRKHDILGYYSEDGVRKAFEAYGFFDLLRERGFEPRFSSEASDEEQHRLRIYDGQADRENLLIELVVWVEQLTLPDGFEGRFLLINWLQMQDPRASWPEGREPLPDQEHPGLGLFIEFAYLLKLVVERIGCDGLLNHPAHPHNGVLYGKFCRFVDPAREGHLRALVRDIHRGDLAQLTADVTSGHVLDAGGQTFAWEPAPQVLPVSSRAHQWFRSSRYRHEVEAVLDATQFHLDFRDETP